jgi:Cytochrome P460
MHSDRNLSLLTLCLAITFAQQAFAQSPNLPKYDGNKLIFPDGFRTGWLFVGSNIGLQYKGEGATVLKDGHPLTAPRQPQVKAPGPPVEFHNVYITPDGYAGFRTSKTVFPDGTVLVIDRYLAQKKEPHDILSAGSFDGDQYGALVAVKDSRRPEGSGPNKTDWSYYVFSADEIAKPGAEEPVSDVSLSVCAACHKRNGLVDNVWVQFYPILRDLPKSGG